MKIGDKVKVVRGTISFGNKQGKIIGSFQPAYDWAVEIEGMSTDSDDTYGFNESELEVIP